ncbi:MAG: glycosyltransferase [Nitrospirota bacterium]|nr:glycosyltransferase [Nitrospirota bacterium]
MNPRVSVCIPVFNGEKYLTETLDSIISQSMRDIEIVISDNASTDNTVSIIADYAKKDKRINVVLNQFNNGYCQNIASAVASSNAEIIAVFHADDVYHPNIVLRELALLDVDSSIDAVFSLPKIFTKSPHKSVRKKFYKDLSHCSLYKPDLGAITGSYEEFLPLILEYGNIFACPSFMTRKVVFQELGGFTDKYPSNEDFELWLKYLKTRHRLGIINDFLFNYRMSDDHASAYWRARPELAVMYKVLDDLVINDRELTEKERKLYRKNRSIGYMRATINAVKRREYINAKNLEVSSRKEYRLDFFSTWGFLQHLLHLIFFLFTIQNLGKRGNCDT